jgi:hypothetical protein
MWVEGGCGRMTLEGDLQIHTVISAVIAENAVGK